MTIAIIILLVVIIGLFWRLQPSKSFTFANSSDWVILKWQTILSDGDPEKAVRGIEPSVNIQFVPVIGWEYAEGKLVPITPPGYGVWDRLNGSRFDNNVEFQASGYLIRDGAVYDIADMHAVDFWTNLLDYAYARTRIEVHGHVPDSYSKRVFEIVSLAEKDELDVNRH